MMSSVPRGVLIALSLLAALHVVAADVCTKNMTLPGYIFYPLRDASGNDITYISNFSVALATCNSNPACVALNTNGYTKSSAQNLRDNTADICGGLYIKTCPKVMAVAGYTFTPLKDSPGNDITSFSNVSVAMATCSSSSNCVAFNTDGFIKSAVNRPSDTTNYVCYGLYIKTCTKSMALPGYTFYPLMDSPGSDASGGQDVSIALASCNSRADCVAFNTDGYVKTGVTTLVISAHDACGGIYIKNCAKNMTRDGYTFLPLQDSPGSDFTTNSNASQALATCNSYTKCAGFNTDGYIKTATASLTQTAHDACGGIYVKKCPNLFGYTFYKMMEVPGNDLVATDPVAAYATCSSNPKCVAFNTNGFLKVSSANMVDATNSYINDDHNVCGGLYVKNPASPPSPPSPPPSPPTPMPAPLVCPTMTGYTFYPMKDAPGNDITSTNPAVAMVTCNSYANCVAFNANGYIKSSIAHLSDSNGGGTNPCYGLYVKTCTKNMTRAGYTFNPIQDSAGNDITGGQDAAIALATCNSNPKCVAFNTDGYVKTGVNAFVYGANDVCSGIYVKMCTKSMALTGYTFYPMADSPGRDMTGGQDVTVALATCNSKPDCVAFNTDGYVKSGVTNLIYTANQNACYGLYIKNCAMNMTRPGYTFYPLKDAPGNDFTTNSNASQALATCNSYTKCAGFNTDGFIKSFSTPPFTAPTLTQDAHDACGGIYIKKCPALPGYTFYKFMDAPGSFDILATDPVWSMSYCNSNPKCVAFNTNGFLKASAANMTDATSSYFNNDQNACGGLYVKSAKPPIWNSPSRKPGPSPSPRPSPSPSPKPASASPSPSMKAPPPSSAGCTKDMTFAGYKFYPLKDAPGNNIANISDAAFALATCNSMTNCVAFNTMGMLKSATASLVNSTADACGGLYVKLCNKNMTRAGFQFYKMEDSPGNDISTITNPATALATCLTANTCVAVNTNGFLKSSVAGLIDSTSAYVNTFHDVCGGIYLKASTCPPAPTGFSFVPKMDVWAQDIITAGVTECIRNELASSWTVADRGRRCQMLSNCKGFNVDFAGSCLKNKITNMTIQTHLDSGRVTASPCPGFYVKM